MEPEIQERIEKTVRKILEESDMEKMTEHKIRKQASDELDLDLSDPPYKAFVRQVVQSFLEQQKEEEQVEEEEEEEQEEQGGRRKEYDDDGDLIICRVRFEYHSSYYCLVAEKINYIFSLWVNLELGFWWQKVWIVTCMLKLLP